MKRGFKDTLIKANQKRAFRHETLAFMTPVVMEVLVTCRVEGSQENPFR